ncbi:hypothetical protein MLD38_026298 [Melastoma candidum]|uniref:Uncharacterized protein n=1 Tax=Melastoma candidum TaxID=119954 RepID=A0ACB9NZZ5_9MYRT|nr:hypothetical protein MLD38_026298 [Melastoma candidum]
MAEISPSPAASADGPSPPPPPLEYDANTMRTTKPGVKRLFLTFSVLVSFLLGFPLLWKSIEIYRAPLPFDDIDSISRRIESNPPQFPCRFRAVFLGFDSAFQDVSGRVEGLKASIDDRMRGFAPEARHCGGCLSKYSVEVTVGAGDECVSSESVRGLDKHWCGVIGGVDFSQDDQIVDDELEGILRDENAYTVVVINDKVVAGMRSIVGKFKHAWIFGTVTVEEAVASTVEIFVKVFSNGGNDNGLVPGEFMPVGADGSIVLSFNLLNADPHSWVYDWDFNRIEEDMISSIVQGLKSIADISVESQVLHYTPKSSYSYWDDKHESNIFSTSDLPFFVNSNEWHLDTSVAAGGRSKILHFVVYIPSAKECPLKLQLADGTISETNGFISPMWGGVTVWNPLHCSHDKESHPRIFRKILPQDLEKIFEVLVGQIRQLFGLKSDEIFIGATSRSRMLASNKGFAEWELDFLARQHTCFNLNSCASTLGSLSRLVQSLPRMIIIDKIGKQVKHSVEAAKNAETQVSSGSFDAAAASSKQARSLAEDAFFDPSITSISYYSFEHCFAVYSPFFLPVTLHVVLAALREMKRYRQENRKYLTWKSKMEGKL